MLGSVAKYSALCQSARTINDHGNVDGNGDGNGVGDSDLVGDCVG